ncbi:MAG TPA: hypothetical protein VHM19_08295 [Polyangiales bacterium]|nr:hypothetical protein [Polyangiales bacterium]
MPPAQIDDLATTCVKYVKDATGLTLDYTAETLPILDHYVRTNAGAAAPDEVRDLLAPTLGAYFGEVVSRTLPGARWHSPDADYTDYRIEFDPFFLCFNPLGVAAEVLAGDDVEGYGAHFQLLDDARAAVEEALARSSSVSADDYYSFTVRYETLELVTQVLLGLEHASHEQPRRFGADVYRAAAGQPVDPKRSN